jgi:cytochrome c556
MARRSLKSPVALALGLALSLTAVGGVAVAAVDAAKVITAREANFKKIGTAFKAIIDGLKADTPDTKAMAVQAKIIKDLSPKIVHWFPKGTGPESGLKTGAKAEIWTDWATFASAAKGLQTESAKLELVAKTGNVDAIKAQVKVTGGACGTCHTKFRAQEKK